MPKTPLTSTLTDRYQTTIPEAVRRHLGLGKRDQVRYELAEDGSVRLSVSQPAAQDPALRPFLALLERDFQEHPQRLVPLGGDRQRRLMHLIQGVEIDLEASQDSADG